MKVDRKKIRELALKGLREGKTKEQVFEELCSLYRDSRIYKEIAIVIKYIPDKWRVKKYGIYNTLFLILLIIIDLINMVTLNYGGFLWFGTLTYLVAAKQTKYYYWLIVFGGIIFISGIGLSLYGYFGSGLNILYMLGGSIILALIFVLFGIYMPKYLTSDYSFIEEITENSEGNKVRRKRIHYN